MERVKHYSGDNSFRRVDRVLKGVYLASVLGLASMIIDIPQEKRSTEVTIIYQDFLCANQPPLTSDQDHLYFCQTLSRNYYQLFAKHPTP